MYHQIIEREKTSEKVDETPVRPIQLKLTCLIELTSNRNRSGESGILIILKNHRGIQYKHKISATRVRKSTCLQWIKQNKQYSKNTDAWQETSFRTNLV